MQEHLLTWQLGTVITNYSENEVMACDTVAVQKKTASRGDLGLNCENEQNNENYERTKHNILQYYGKVGVLFIFLNTF